VIAFAAASQLAVTWLKYAVWVAPLLLVVAIGIYAWGHYQDTKKAAAHDAAVTPPVVK
jgi:heme/copper-type cytochrome/quinol oxidase subunit 2